MVTTVQIQRSVVSVRMHVHLVLLNFVGKIRHVENKQTGTCASVVSYTLNLYRVSFWFLQILVTLIVCRKLSFYYHRQTAFFSTDSSPVYDQKHGM